MSPLSGLIIMVAVGCGGEDVFFNHVKPSVWSVLRAFAQGDVVFTSVSIPSVGRKFFQPMPSNPSHAAVVVIQCPQSM